MSDISINRLTNANIYMDGASLLGRAEEVTLPSINYIMTEHKAVGMVGKLEFFAGIEKMEAKIKWNSYYPEVFKKAANPFKTVNLQIRASLETYESGGKVAEVPVVCYITAAYKGFPLGNYKQHDNVELDSNLTVYMTKLEIDGSPIIEFDALSNIFKADGVDLLAQYRANIGG